MTPAKYAPRIQENVLAGLPVTPILEEMVREARISALNDPAVINRASISAADMPYTVLQKLQDALAQG